jgi:hypothetical protein
MSRLAHSLVGAENSMYFVIPSKARNLSEGCANEKKERFLSSPGMTKSRRDNLKTGAAKIRTPTAGRS